MIISVTEIEANSRAALLAHGAGPTQAAAVAKAVARAESVVKGDRHALGRVAPGVARSEPTIEFIGIKLRQSVAQRPAHGGCTRAMVQGQGWHHEQCPSDHPQNLHVDGLGCFLTSL